MMLQMQSIELTLLTTDVLTLRSGTHEPENWSTRISEIFEKILFFQCVFTTISSMIGFIANVGISHLVYLEPFHWKHEVEYYWEPERHCWAEYGHFMIGPRHDWAAEPDWARGLPCRSAFDDDIHNEQISAELTLVQILTIESFLFFGKTSRILAVKNII